MPLIGVAGHGRRATVAGPALSAGTIIPTAGDTQVVISQGTSPSGGTAPYTKNLFRSTTNGVKGSEIVAAVTLPYTDTGRTNGVTYYYTLEVDDSAAASADTAQVSATPESASPLVFASDWSTTTGTSTTAIGDGGLWPTVGPVNSDDLAVIASTGLDFPATMANVFAIRYKGNTARGLIINDADNRWDPPGTGEDVYYRMYIRSQLFNAAVSSSQHPIGSGNGELLGGWAFVHRVATNPFRWWLTTNYPPDVNQIHRWEANLAQDTTYRLEWHIHRVSATEFTEDIRVYNSAGTLVLDNSDFSCTWSGHGHTLDSAPVQRVVETTATQSWCQFQISHQGWYDFTDDGANRIYYGGVAVSRSNWCGPYTLGESPV